ncbi:MAG: hypothetical protein KIT83_16945 [Bryobacterales bacterium]|nr:hypothetical protein [Bryobacterales bacterium]
MRLKSLAALLLVVLFTVPVFAQSAFTRGGSVNRTVEREKSARAGSTEFAFVSKQDAERQIADFGQPDTSAAMWIWSDKYVYQPGESLTLRWTLKPNNDVMPYTIVAYRVNNQTGAKFYVPTGNSTPVDIFGNTFQDGFRIVRLPAANKQVLLGASGLLGGTVTIPNELGMHTLTVELRDYTGTKVLKTSYWKIGVVNEFVNVTGNVTGNTTWENTKAYRVSGLVYIENDATLTINPGTFVIGQPGSQPPSAVVVTRSGKINASGTRARPIIMTSSLPFGQRTPGDWGGVVLLGRARVNWPTGTGIIEGLPSEDRNTYGGTDDAHNCGTLKYVRVEFAGAEFQPNNEVNGITWGGCGTATVTEHVQTSYGFDDNFEWFGGTNSGKWLVSTYARDDHFDGQIGWTGALQYGVAVANLDNSNRGIEMDNNETNFTLQPVSRPRFWNLTFVGSGDQLTEGVDEGTGVAAIWMRRGTAGALRNILAFNWVSGGLEVRDQATVDRIADNTLAANGLLLWDNGKARNRANTLEGQSNNLALPWISGQNGTAVNVIVADPMMRRPLEYSDPDFRGRPGSPIMQPRWVLPPDNGFFDQTANFLGAFGEERWDEEWTNYIQEVDFQ